MILNTRTSFSLCALLAILTPSVIEAVPEKDNPLSPPLLRSKGGFNALAPKANS